MRLTGAPITLMTVASSAPGSLTENPNAAASDLPSPFGEKVTAGDPSAGVTAEIAGATVSTVTLPVRGAMALFQPSTAFSVQAYEPSATGWPPEKPAPVALTTVPGPVASATP